jgi:hypothetical protein
MGANKSPVVCVETVFVPGGRIGSFGEDGAEEGAWIAIDGIVMGGGGGVFVLSVGGSCGLSSICGFCGFSGASVCVEAETK